MGTKAGEGESEGVCVCVVHAMCAHVYLNEQIEIGREQVEMGEKKKEEKKIK